MKKKDIEFLYSEGFALHWLKPRSKEPIGNWRASPERAELPALLKQYQKGMNLGVRLGAASKLKDGHYLAVIDCDVKSKSPHHQRQMAQALKEFFPEANSAPIVHSGRGNGSMHVYVKTLEPAKPFRVTQSKDLVEVHMPSVVPSKRDVEQLGGEKTSKGIRLRAAWEISLMGEGQQVVLPPSIHPDSGRPYAWAVPDTWEPIVENDIPLFEGSAPEKKDGAPSVPGRVFKFADDFDLDLAGLDSGTMGMIVDGDGVSDRSSALFLAGMAMVKAGLSDDEIATVLTDKTYYLGRTAFDHAKTTSRERAAAWLDRFTLQKVRREYSCEADFKEPYVAPEPLSLKAAKAQFEELTAVSSWLLKIERAEKTDKPKNTLENVVLILENDVGANLFRRNEFSGNDIYGMPGPWGGQVDAEITDSDIVAMKLYIAKKFRFEPSNDKLNEAVMMIARKNRFHPVRDYLLGLEWDGTPRIGSWLKDYFGATGSPEYLEAVSRKVLCAMVARVMHPGTKFDQVLILQGDQGVGKSTAIRNLASKEWFSDQTINMADKDSVLNMRGVWALELGELSGMRQADVELLKEFISRSTDRIRVPYGKRTEAFPRQCIFIGSTNKDYFLRDTTGNRRFWPVKVTRADFKGIARVRDQLFAEAVLSYDMGEPLYLEGEDAQAQSRTEQDSRMLTDTLVESVQSFFKALEKTPEKDRTFPLSGFTLHQAFEPYGPFGKLKDTKAEQMRAAEALRQVGFEAKQRWVNGKVRLWERIGKDVSPILPTSSKTYRPKFFEAGMGNA